MTIQNIVLIRHGQTDESEVIGPHTPLTEVGREQAAYAGKKFDTEWLSNSVVYCSTHLRCRQTLECMSLPNKSVQFDPLLREVEYGPNSTYLDIQYELKCQERKRLGRFYYRFKDGESPADAYTRACLFWQSVNQTNKNNLLIVSHGMMIRILAMRWMQWSPEEYDELNNIGNCQTVSITKNKDNWEVCGLENNS